MKLILGNGYPFPYPDYLSEVELNAINETAPSISMAIDNVRGIEWKYTLTVEFDTLEHLQEAEKLTGWPRWGRCEFYYILEAFVSVLDGYDHPAVVVGGKAFCALMVRED